MFIRIPKNIRHRVYNSVMGYITTVNVNGTKQWLCVLISGPVCLQDSLLRPGFYVDERSSQRIRVETELWRNSPNVERRVYH